MDITIYLPDELGERAKREGINLSRMLRDELAVELQRRATMAQTLNSPHTFELSLEREGEGYVGRVTGKRIAEGHYVEVFLTDDERVLLYDESRSDYWVIEDPAEELRDCLDDDEYARALAALGLTVVVDL